MDEPAREPPVARPPRHCGEDMVRSRERVNDLESVPVWRCMTCGATRSIGAAVFEEPVRDRDDAT